MKRSNDPEKTVKAAENEKTRNSIDFGVRPRLVSDEHGRPIDVALRPAHHGILKDETPNASFTSSQKNKPLSAHGSDDSRVRTRNYVLNNANNPGPTFQTPRQNSARFPSQSIGYRIKKILAAVSNSLIPPSSPSESMTNATDLDTNRTGSEWGAGAEFRLQSARSRRESLLEDHQPGTTTFEQAVDVVVVERDFDEILVTDGHGNSFGVAGSENAVAPNLDSGGINGLGVTGSTIGSGGNVRSDRSATESRGRQNGSHHTRLTTASFASLPPYAFLRWRVGPAIYFFFESNFSDPGKESSYVKERWFVNKASAIAGALFFYLVWVITMATQIMPIPLFNKMTYLPVGGACIAPILVVVARDWPRKRPLTYNVLLFLATWTFPYCFLFDMWHCGFYTSNNTCGEKDFLALFFWALAPATFALFMMGQKRIFAAAGAVGYVVLICVLIVPDRPKFARNLINFILFQVAIQWSSFVQEKSQRRMFSMREQLKAQYKATQKAQIAERQSAESKKRFVSYIFHEVRVPLNTALLAFQNLEGEDIFKAVPEDSREMITGLSSSLITMEKVLNDVLDFNRMEAGRLICTNKPFELHPTIRQILMAFRAVAAAKDIDLVLDLDPAIDAFSPYLLGDDMRISQVISNLSSNACKFTPTGGSVTFKTRLLHPTSNSNEKSNAIIIPVTDEKHPLKEIPLDSPTSEDAMPFDRTLRQDVAIIRMEITDSGVGIRPRDLVDNRLFSPYVQTAIGRTQGGKGSGLGLALVRKIIKLSGGRLGVHSAVNTGSTFWFELPFEKTNQKSPDKKWPSMTKDASILQTLDPNKSARSSKEMAQFGVPSSPEPSGSLKERAKDPLQRAELVAAQIPIAMDAGGVPVSGIPELTPVDDSQREKLNVLVVDDDGLTRKLMTRMITRMGHEVTCAEDGLIALNLLRDSWTAKEPNRYDIIFLDNQMPRMNGVEVVREARRVGLRNFFCGVTGNALKEDQDEYLAAGVDRILTKPVLERNVRDACAQARERVKEIHMSDRPATDYIDAYHASTVNSPSSPRIQPPVITLPTTVE